MGSIGGHALVALTSTLTMVQWLFTTQPKGWVMKFADREPIVFFSCLLGAVGMGMPLVVPPIRRRLGYSTSQIDGYQDD
ncbi:hypothetical protein CTAYLR_008627 [Chrysophaeum taylorii]|uniref:Uncharacterized protein n=1 Tax=Chrysophaeum taylorii TaxID=2483200 RepID=A0AAD7UHM5_9STRA|nr:hypothetical protein CTAYLR_008627 [Chrysophaeum taylorii]